jgi:hypothetical protein
MGLVRVSTGMIVPDFMVCLRIILTIGYVDYPAVKRSFRVTYDQRAAHLYLESLGN